MLDSLSQHGHEEVDDDILMREGMKSLIRSSLMATSTHICSAPIAAYLVRNEDRFHFSHPLKYINVKLFHEPSIVDYDLGRVDAKPIIKSQICTSETEAY